MKETISSSSFNQSNNSAMKKKKLKIAHVTYNMIIGGAERVICNIVENTDPSRYDVSIICIDSPVGPFGIQLRNQGYQVTAFNRVPGFDFRLVLKMRKHILQNHIEVLHCHQYSPYVYGVLGAAFTGCRVIFTEHGRHYPDVRRPKRILANPILSLLTEYINAISAATRKALIEYENFPGDRIDVVYNGIDDIQFKLEGHDKLRQEVHLPENGYILGTVARLDAIKNQKMMIKALKRLHDDFPEACLLIVGDGPERRSLEEFAARQQVSSRVVFTGFREDAYLFYRIMDVLLLTSFSEGTSMTLLEAMAHGIPCVATDVGGNPEIVIDGKTGFLVPSEDDQTLAERISLLAKDQDLRKRMGNAGRDRFEAQFTVTKMVRAYQAMYEDRLPKKKYMLRTMQQLTQQQNR
jgi:glycosyltransferase involved in cell wall biosynthesis